MADATVTTLDSILKEYYTDQRVRDTMYKDRPFLALVAKANKWPGRNLPVPIRYGHPQGRSATFATAQTNATSALVEQFLMTNVADYSVATFDSASIDATSSGDGSFIDVFKLQVDGAGQQLARDLALQVYRARTGLRGVVATSGITTVDLTLANINDATNFEINQEVVGAATEGSGAIRAGNATITAINTDTGVLTTDSNWTTQITSLADADSIFVQGDRTTASQTLKLAGLEGWIPATASATAFYGVDRTLHTRLGGVRRTGTSLTLKEALVTGQADAAVVGGSPTHCFLHPKQFRELIKSEMTNRTYSMEDVSVGKLGFRALVLEGATGPIRVMADMNCPSTVAWLLQMDTWKLVTHGSAPHIADEDGLRILRQATSDGYEVRWRYRGNLCCDFPGGNVRISLNNAT